LTLDTSPQFDLQVDSLEWVTITIEIERRFGVALTGDALSRILTLRDLLREIETASPATAATGLPPFELPGPLLRTVGAALYALLRLLMSIAWRIDVVSAADLPEHGALLITPNHTSYLDPPALAAALPWRQLRRTYWAGWVGVMHSSPLRRLLSRATQVFPIDPDRDLAGALRTAQALLDRGYSVVWFPEGRRSPTGALAQFQAGVGMLLKNGMVTAIPTAIQGTYSLWPKQRRWPKFGRIRVTFGAGQTFNPIPHERDPGEIRGTLEQAVHALLNAAPEPGGHDESPPS
jgi:long-chain acyl-CoA synthetase